MWLFFRLKSTSYPPSIYDVYITSFMEWLVRFFFIIILCFFHHTSSSSSWKKGVMDACIWISISISSRLLESETFHHYYLNFLHISTDIFVCLIKNRMLCMIFGEFGVCVGLFVAVNKRLVTFGIFEWNYFVMIPKNRFGLSFIHPQTN